MYSFKELIQAISEKLGPTSGLDSDDVDPQDLIDLMSEYTSNPAEWTPYALGDLSRNYTRNLVDDTNGKSNILVVCWVCTWLAIDEVPHELIKDLESRQREPDT